MAAFLWGRSPGTADGFLSSSSKLLSSAVCVSAWQEYRDPQHYRHSTCAAAAPNVLPWENKTPNLSLRVRSWGPEQKWLQRSLILVNGLKS